MQGKLSRQKFANVEPADAVYFTHRQKGARYADLVAFGYSREYLASDLSFPPWDMAYLTLRICFARLEPAVSLLCTIYEVWDKKSVFWFGRC
jgi:hypothetical protein